VRRRDWITLTLTIIIAIMLALAARALAGPSPLGADIAPLAYSNNYYWSTAGDWEGWIGSGITGMISGGGPENEPKCYANNCLYARNNGSYLQSPNQTKTAGYNVRAMIRMGSAGSQIRYVRFYTMDGVERCGFSTTSNGFQTFNCSEENIQAAIQWYFRFYTTGSTIVTLDNVTLSDVAPAPTSTPTPTKTATPTTTPTPTPPTPTPTPTVTPTWTPGPPLYAYEPFDYPGSNDGDPLNGLDGGTGWAGPWSAGSGGAVLDDDRALGGASDIFTAKGSDVPTSRGFGEFAVGDFWMSFRFAVQASENFWHGINIYDGGYLRATIGDMNYQELDGMSVTGMKVVISGCTRTTNHTLLLYIPISPTGTENLYLWCDPDADDDVNTYDASILNQEMGSIDTIKIVAGSGAQKGFWVDDIRIADNYTFAPPVTSTPTATPTGNPTFTPTATPTVTPTTTPTTTPRRLVINSWEGTPSVEPRLVLYMHGDTPTPTVTPSITPIPDYSQAMLPSMDTHILRNIETPDPYKSGLYIDLPLTPPIIPGSKALIRFILPTVTPENLARAELVFHARSVYMPMNLRIHGVAKEWDESATWNYASSFDPATPWATPGAKPYVDYYGKPVATVSVAGSGFYTADITSLVRDWIAGVKQPAVIIVPEY